MIKELIIAWTKAYKEVNAEKLKAKECIENAKQMKKNWVLKQDEVRIVLKILGNLYLSLPKEPRKNYVQGTIDLLQYGIGVPRNNWKDGIIKLYQENVIDKIDRYIKYANKQYKKNNYNEVIKNYDDLIENVKEQLKIWDT